MIVHNIALAERRVNTAQQSVNQGFQMFGSNGRQPHQPHAVVSRQSRGEVIAAIHRDIESQLDQTLADLFVVGFDATVFRNYASPSNESYADGLPDSRNYSGRQ